MPREAPVTKATLPSSWREEEIFKSGITAVAIPILPALVQRFKDCSDALSATNAHGYEGILPADSMQFVRRLDGDDGPGCAQWMAQRNSATIRIRLLGWKIKFALDRKRLGRERFIHLEYIDLRHAQPGAVKHSVYGGNGPDAHECRFHAGYRVVDQSGKRLEVALFRGMPFHQHHGGGAVINARGITGGHCTRWVESWLQFGQGLDACVGPWRLIRRELNGLLLNLEFDGDNLALEPAFLN